MVNLLSLPGGAPEKGKSLPASLSCFVTLRGFIFGLIQNQMHMAKQDNKGQDPSLRKAELAVETMEMVHKRFNEDGPWIRRALVWALACQATHFMNNMDFPMPDDDGLPMALAVNYQLIEDLEVKAKEYETIIEEGGKNGPK